MVMTMDTDMDTDTSQLLTPPQVRPARYQSPLDLSIEIGDDIANFTEDSSGISRTFVGTQRDIAQSPRFMLSGPRRRLAYRGEEVRAGIITCGGLCPGLNDVIRSVVNCLWRRYAVRDIRGFRYGYFGLTEQGLSEQPPIELNPDVVRSIHRIGGSILGSSRGTPDFGEIVETLRTYRINQLYCIGGDGTMRGAMALAAEIKAHGLEVSVIGIPKTIDNDLPFVERTFGFDTAIAMSVEAVRAARAEASSGIRGLGLVRLMGRHAGFIAANAAISSREVDLVLVPELPFSLGDLSASERALREVGALPYIQRVLRDHGEAVVVVAEGVGQGQAHQPTLSLTSGHDASGNSKLGDVGLALKQRLQESFTAIGEPINLKYIDPSYMIRATPVSSADAMYCAQLAEDAVHTAMAGFTETLIGLWGGVGTLVPFTLLKDQEKRLDLDGPLWRSVLDATGQPSSLGGEPLIVS